MSDFHAFATAVNKRLTELSAGELLVTDPVDLFETYLAAFPEGTDPIFRVNSWHHCSCCRNFLRNMGHLVAVGWSDETQSMTKETIWDIPNLPYPYDVVAKRLHDVVMQARITGVYRSSMPGHGNESTRERRDDDTVHTWNHFFGTVARRHKSTTPEAKAAELNTTAQVLNRGLDLIKPEALAQVLELIDANALYRGDTYRASLVEFQRIQKVYHDTGNSELVVWDFIGSPAAKLKNTAIGQLLQALSDGEELESAVRSFERMVAPENYKRPTALITPRMIDAALKTVDELGIGSALERRFAVIGDVSVADVLFVDNAVKNRMKAGDLRSTLLGAVVPKAPKDGEALPIGIADFVTSVLPTATGIELLLKNRHLGNFVSLTAPVHADAERLFKWRNPIAWSYDGNVTDSIKQRVKTAGGNTNAALRVSLAWRSYDDLDLHSDGPHGNIYFGDRSDRAGNRILDVDMNAGGGSTREPVENQSWTQPKDGDYLIVVNQYAQREPDLPGFTLELECNGRIMQFSHPKALRSKQSVECLRFTMKGGVLSDLKVSKELTGGDLSVPKWGVSTEAFVPVAAVMNSPNHWEGAGEIGHKHWFFMLQGCHNDQPARGLYNEFLRSDLEAHRKVFEVLGNKTLCQPTPDQLSGVGFTAGRNDEVTVKVTSGTASRLYTISF